MAALDRFDVVVMGAGAAGLTTALVCADRGAKVLVLERSPQLGGTTAISGGQVWVPNNRFNSASDARERAMHYLRQVALGEVENALLQAFVDAAPQMASDVERLSPVRFFQVQRPDYHSEWPGSGFGRSLEPEVYDLTRLGVTAAAIRRSPYRPPLTSAELKKGTAPELVVQRTKEGKVTQGVALVAGLVEGCKALGVTFRTDARVVELTRSEQGEESVVRYLHDGKQLQVNARALVVASGGFEWNIQLKQAFLRSPDEGAASPPWNEGDGLMLGMRAGASLANMTESWWSAAFVVPGEAYDGKPLVRNIVRELALAGSILVNAQGARFVNEASSYNALGKAFQIFDPQRNEYVNKRAWLVFDQAFKDSYSVATIPASASAPDWFLQGETIEQLASKAGIDAAGLARQVDKFNACAARGVDDEFGRGVARHDLYHGSPTAAHPNLGVIARGPFYAVPIFLGNLGTKGGLRTDAQARVLDMKGTPIDGLFACGNAAASWMGPGYPGAGGSLGPIMTSAYLCGKAVATCNSWERSHGQ